MDKAELVLASGSPRRAELLSNLGLAFKVVPSDIDESAESELSPEELVLKLALEKAKAVAARLDEQRSKSIVVLGADTIVALEDRIIGKPSSKDDAKQMLSLLSGRCHEVYTGVALIGMREYWERSGFAVSRVYIRKLEPLEISAYVETGEPNDKAGAYALQGIASAFVEKIDGCFTNIIGLPVPLTVSLLRQAGVSILGLPPALV